MRDASRYAGVTINPYASPRKSMSAGESDNDETIPTATSTAMIPPTPTGSTTTLANTTVFLITTSRS